MRRPLLALALLAAVGCASTDTILLGTPANYPEVAADDVVVYRTADQVPGQYEEIALLTASGSSTYTSQAGMVESMREKAGKLGANAIVLDATSEPSAGAKAASALFTFGVVGKRQGRAVAIRVLPTPRVSPAPADPDPGAGRATTVPPEPPARGVQEPPPGAVEPSTSSEEPPPLHKAAAAGDALLVTRLLAEGADVNGLDSHGATPLHVAALYGRTGVAERLLTEGADVNASEADTMPFRAGGNFVMAPTGEGHTPLHWAVAGRHTAMAEFLVARGADVNAKTGDEPLHFAVIMGDVAMADVLLTCGADVEAIRDGKTPLESAKTDAMRSLLREYGAEPISPVGAETQQSGEQAPDAERPRVEFLDRNPGGVALLDITVWGRPRQTEAPVLVLPTGTSGVCVEIRMRGRAPDGTTFAIAIEHRGGQPVNREGVNMSLWNWDRAAGESTLSMCPPGGEPYPDGSYTGTVTVGGVEAAVLHWFVGAKPPGEEPTGPTDASRPIVLTGHTDTVRSVAFSPDGQRVVTASADGTARVWRSDGTGEAIVLDGHDGPLWTAVFSPDGTHVVTGSRSAARIWPADGVGDPVVLRHRRDVGQVAYSPDGLRILTASHDGTARVWRADGTDPVVLSHQSSVNRAVFDSDGTHVLTTVLFEFGARLWRSDGTGEPEVFAGHSKFVTDAAFSAEGTRFVTASADGTAHVWRADEEGEPVVLTHDTVINDVTFSPDGSRVLAASGDAAWVWRADGTGEPIVLRGHTDILNTATFGPDGRLAATASTDGTARVWNVDGSDAPVVLSHDGSVWSAVFSPDGSRVATASADRTARVWRIK